MIKLIRILELAVMLLFALFAGLAFACWWLGAKLEKLRRAL